MGTKSYFAGVVLAAVVISAMGAANAQEPVEEASWGQMKAMLLNSARQLGGAALSMRPAGEQPAETDESDLLGPLDREIQALAQIRGTCQQVCRELKDLGFRLESFASEEEAERVLCSAGEGIALSRLTYEGECPAIHRYRIMDDQGATVHFGFYTLPASSLVDLPVDGLVTACWEDVRYGGDHINYSSSTTYVGYWWNDEFSSIQVGYSSLGGYYKYYANSQYGGSSMIVHSNEQVSSLCPTGWNDRISSLRKYQ